MSSLAKLFTSSIATGTMWQRIALPTAGTWYGVAAGDKKYVAIRGQQENFSTGVTAGAFSNDGYSWQSINLTSTNCMKYDIGYGNNTFVSMGINTSTIVTSNNGLNWTLRSSGTPSGWISVAYGRNTWCIIAFGSRAICTSPDGISWTYRGTALPVSQNWWRIRFGNGLFIATGLSSTSYATSTDGITFISRTFPSVPNCNTWRNLAYGNGTWVAVGFNTGVDNAIALRSADGISWTTVTLPFAAQFSSVIFTGKLFVALALGGRTIISVDGTNWTNIQIPSESCNFINMAYDEVGDKLIATGFGGTGNNVLWVSPPAGFTPQNSK